LWGTTVAESACEVMPQKGSPKKGVQIRCAERRKAYILYDPLMTGGRDGAYSRSYVKRVGDASPDVFMNGILAPARGRGLRRGGRKP